MNCAFSGIMLICHFLLSWGLPETLKVCKWKWVRGEIKNWITSNQSRYYVVNRWHICRNHSCHYFYSFFLQKKSSSPLSNVRARAPPHFTTSVCHLLKEGRRWICVEFALLGNATTTVTSHWWCQSTAAFHNICLSPVKGRVPLLYFYHNIRLRP